MSESVEIVGIMLVHNEDRFVRRAIQNVLTFCDRILVADHRSTDGTLEIVRALAREHSKIELHQISDPSESSDLLQPLAGKNVWVLGVDGDEIYDPAGLAEVRRDLQSGAWKEWWVVFGNVLNCVSLDEGTNTASGYMAPPCRSMTKLYNFSMLERLDPESPQRLMGRNNIFKPGFDVMRRHDLYKTTPWEEARFRCLHTCFMTRSSAQPAGAGERQNFTESSSRSALGWLRRMAQVFGFARGSSYKQDKYKRGPLVTVDSTPFFP